MTGGRPTPLESKVLHTNKISRDSGDLDSPLIPTALGTFKVGSMTQSPSLDLADLKFRSLTRIAQPNTISMGTTYVAVHGGAGYHSSDHQVKQALRR